MCPHLVDVFKAGLVEIPSLGNEYSSVLQRTKGQKLLKRTTTT